MHSSGRCIWQAPSGPIGVTMPELHAAIDDFLTRPVRVDGMVRVLRAVGPWSR